MSAPPAVNLSYELTTAEGLKNVLENRLGVTNVELQSLAGGTANYVYRLKGPNREDEGRNWILKHAAGHLASNHDFHLPPSRMDFEARILTHKLEDDTECHCTTTKASSKSGIKLEKAHVHTVPLLFYEKDIKLLCIQDAGNRSLLDAYQDLSEGEVQEIGTEIGRWLAKLHAKTPQSSVTGSSNLNNQVGVNIARHTYNNLSSTFTHTGYDAELGTSINSTFGELLAVDDESVCHGDFWPGNIMLQSNSSVEKGSHILTVIDWEMVRVGTSATDVGQFAAEAFVLDRFHGNKGLRAAFIRAYFHARIVEFGSQVFKTTELLNKWMIRAAVHFAAHLAVWPSRKAHWASREDTRPLLELAVAILKDVTSLTPDVKGWELFEGVLDLDVIPRDVIPGHGSP